MEATMNLLTTQSTFNIGSTNATHIHEPTRAELTLRNRVANRKLRKPPQLGAREILASFNTWAYKREQPDDAAKMLRVIEGTISQNAPLSFVLYWGKGPRNEAGAHEAECIQYLSSMRKRIADVYNQGAEFKVIFTDSHARLNGHSVLSYTRYFRSVDDLLGASDWTSCYLASLVRDARPLLHEYDAVANPADTTILDQLTATAQKWYRGPGRASDGALAYYVANMSERQAVQLAFPDSIFLTFNGSELRPLFPTDMPIFYMYSLKKGFGVKPWFMD
jgi:hypothetical protein